MESRLENNRWDAPKEVSVYFAGVNENNEAHQRDISWLNTRAEIMPSDQGESMKQKKKMWLRNAASFK